MKMVCEWGEIIMYSVFIFKISLIKDIQLMLQINGISCPFMQVIK